MLKFSGIVSYISSYSCMPFIVYIVKQHCSEALLLCQISTNVMKQMNVIRHQRRASMSQEPTAATVYPDSTVLLVARLATVDTCRYIVLFRIFTAVKVNGDSLLRYHITSAQLCPSV